MSDGLAYILAIEAGPARAASRPPNFMLGRLKRTCEFAHDRHQNRSRARVLALASADLVDRVVYSCPGMPNEGPPIPVEDVVPSAAFSAYATVFAKMDKEDLRAITRRAEQPTRTLIDLYRPALG